MNQLPRMAIWIALLVALALVGYMMQRLEPVRFDYPMGLEKTGLAMEFVKTPFDRQSVIGPDNKYAPNIRSQQYWDFLFIPLYVALFAFLGREIRFTDIPAANWFSWIAIACAIFAGLADIGENTAILATLNNEAAIPWITRFSWPKWGLAFAAVLLDCIPLFAWPKLKLWERAVALITGALLFVAGITGLFSSIFDSPVAIVRDAGRMRFALEVLLVFLILVTLRLRLSRAR